MQEEASQYRTELENQDMVKKMVVDKMEHKEQYELVSELVVSNTS